MTSFINEREIIYIFTDFEKACIAAIEYVISKYGENIWFNAALHKTVTNVYVKSRNDICTFPFTIIKTEKFTNEGKNIINLTYKGSHYIINQMEKYNNYYNKSYTIFQTIGFICILNIFIYIAIILLATFLKRVPPASFKIMSH